MQKVSFSMTGRRYEVKLESDFALYVRDSLTQNEIVSNRDTEPAKLFKAYLKALKQNYENEKQIEALLVEISTKLI